MSALIVTLKLDANAFEVFDRLRQQHFPPERNFLSAHITLFHALPGEQESIIQQTLKECCSQTTELVLRFPKVRWLGRGVAIDVHCPELIQVHKQLALAWNEWLTPQDQQGYRPHITIQNKVSTEEARRLYDPLDRTWKPFEGKGRGLLLWYYRGGPWELVSEFFFQPLNSISARSTD